MMKQVLVAVLMLAAISLRADAANIPECIECDCPECGNWPPPPPLCPYPLVRDPLTGQCSRPQPVCPVCHWCIECSVPQVFQRVSSCVDSTITTSSSTSHVGLFSGSTTSSNSISQFHSCLQSVGISPASVSGLVTAARSNPGFVNLIKSTQYAQRVGK